MLVYNVGFEGSHIVEKENYDGSIFSNQYKRALRLVDKYITIPLSDTTQIVCFSGDRGEGKTSCMQTVREIILSDHTGEGKEKLEANLFLKELGCKGILSSRFEGLDIIDPSYFDNDHNLLEVIIGKLYGKIKSIAKNQGARLDRIAYRNLTILFEKVKQSIFCLHKSTSDSYSELTELDMLSSGTDLRNIVKNLFRDYLKFIEKDKLLITIDDIDMNMSGAYEMCEHIRKYLSSSFCVVMMAVKFEQLEEVVARGISSGVPGLKTPLHAYSEFESMAHKYLLKLLPMATRIFMPTVYGMCNQPMRVILSSFNKEKPIEEYSSIKDAIVKIIFRKTRFLFYNSKGGVSLIVPNNLRQLMSILGMLYAMEEIIDQTKQLDALLVNKATFKNYFFHSWPKHLPDQYRFQILEWVEDTPLSVINKSVVAWLTKEFKNELARQYNTSGNNYAKYTENLIYAITESQNFSYNVSVGDVFYLLNLLSLDHLDVAKERMLFFIKSLYSIMLYETYDVVTFDLYDDSIVKDYEDSSGLYRVDHRFDFTNDLQRLINGSYFSFIPGELLPTDQTRFFHFDKRVINGSPKATSLYSLHDLLEECDRIIETFDPRLESRENMKINNGISEEQRQIIIKGHDEDEERDKQLYRLAEFFILCISMSIGSSDIEAFYQGKDGYRHGAKVASFSDFNYNTGYYVFDIMAPFYNLTNTEFCFWRFHRMIGGMFDFSCSHDFSLLRELLEVSAANRQHIDNKNIQGQLHCLMSDSILRNGEVISAIFENARARRYDDHAATDLEKISRFYNDIYNSGMKTHSKKYNSDRDDSKDDSHLIVFNFLYPLMKFIKSIPEMLPEVQEWFFSIFNFVEEKRKTDFEEQQKLKLPKVNLKKEKSSLSEKQLEFLRSELSSVFGKGLIGDSSVVFEILSGIFKEELAKMKDTDLIKHTEKGKVVEYNVDKIIDVIQQPRQVNQLKVWKKLFNIA